MLDRNALGSEKVAQYPSVTLPEKPLCAHDGGWKACRQRKEVLDGFVEFGGQHVVGITAKPRRFESHVQRRFVLFGVPESSEVFKPGIFDPLALQRCAQAIPVEMRECARPRKAANVSERTNLTCCQKCQEFFEGSIGVADSEETDPRDLYFLFFSCFLSILPCFVFFPLLMSFSFLIS
jgi:hypothetical protein